MSLCLTCGNALTDANWSLSCRKRNRHLCKDCVSKQNAQYYADNSEQRIKIAKEYHKKHPEKHIGSSKDYMRNYMKEYRKTHRDRIDEIARLTFHRRDRELSTDTILNKHFEGAHLHHMTPSVAIYIPKKLHRSIYHNLKTGKGMVEINKKVTEWLNRFSKVE